jgi:hypothetical protein
VAFEGGVCGEDAVCGGVVWVLIDGVRADAGTRGGKANVDNENGEDPYIRHWQNSLGDTEMAGEAATE